MVVAYEIQTGTRFRICAVGTQIHEKLHLPYLDFLREAQHSVPKEWPKLVRILDQSAESGPPRDRERSKPIAGYDALFEFRTKGGLRLFWFYDDDRLVICANGFVKQGQKTPKGELKAAERWRIDYLKAKQDKTLKFLPK
jgi:phage-related protein